MRCPYCNEEMICGSVQSQREIFFTTKPDQNWLIPSINKKDEIMLVSAKYCYVTRKLRLHQNDRCKRFTLF